jgi:hypothetical protein
MFWDLSLKKRNERVQNIGADVCLKSPLAIEIVCVFNVDHHQLSSVVNSNFTV